MENPTVEKSSAKLIPLNDSEVSCKENPKQPKCWPDPCSFDPPRAKHCLRQDDSNYEVPQLQELFSLLGMNENMLKIYSMNYNSLYGKGDWTGEMKCPWDKRCPDHSQVITLGNILPSIPHDAPVFDTVSMKIITSDYCDRNPESAKCPPPKWITCPKCPVDSQNENFTPLISDYFSYVPINEEIFIQEVEFRQNTLTSSDVCDVPKPPQHCTPEPHPDKRCRGSNPPPYCADNSSSMTLGDVMTYPEIMTIPLVDLLQR